MILPGAWLEEYLATDGLGFRLANLADRFPLPHAGVEAALELSLEAYWLFQRFPLPQALEARILARLDELGGDLLIVASGLSCGASALELWSAGTRAALLSAIRTAWSRAYAPCVGRVPAWPTVAIVEQSSLSPGELAQADRWSERLVDGQCLGMSSRELESRFEAATTGGGVAELAEIGAYARYALGCNYNSLLAPEHPFEFLDLLGSGGTAGQALRERYLALSLAGGKTEGQAYIDLATRSLALEAAAIHEEPSRSASLAAPGISSLRNRDDKVHAQQLIGSPSSPGRGAGRLRHAPCARADDLVLVCERFNQGLLALKPLAVIESQGGRLGVGALLARAAGIPCVSGVRDAGLLPDGIVVRVDGWLGLVSVASD